MRCGVYHPADARNRAAGRPQTNRAQASSWRPPTHPFSPSERERWAGARLAGPLNAQNLPPRRQTRGTRRRVLWPSAVAPDQPCFVTPAGMPRHRTWQPLPFRGWGGEGRGAWTAGSHVRPGHRCGHWTAVHRRASCWRAPSQGLDKKERRANARHPLPPSKNNAHGPPREGSGGGGPPVEPGHATTSWATAGRTRAVGSARRPTSRIPRVTADPSTLLPPPALGLRLLTARTARQEHLPAAVQSTQRTGWGSGDDRRPPAARQGRHSARPPRLRCAGGRADGQGSCWVPHSSPPPPSTFRRAADADRLPGERIWAGGHQAPVQLGPQARRGELPATPPPPPTPPPARPRAPPPGPTRNPGAGQDWLVSPHSAARVRPPPPPAKLRTGGGLTRVPRACAEGSGAPRKVWSAAQFACVASAYAPYPQQRTLGGWRGSICSQSLSRYRPKCASGRGWGGLSCGPLEEWDGGDATAAPASSFVSARGRCSTLEPPDDGGAVARPPAAQRTQPCRCSRRRRCRRRRAADPAPLVCGCTPWRSHTRWWPLCVHVHVQSSRIVLDPPTPLSPFTL